MPTAWTVADRTAIHDAIVALASGKRVVSVTFADRTTQFHQTDLKMLTDLLATIEAALGSATGARQNHRLAAIRKGT